MARTTHVQRTMKYYREQGVIIGVVERFAGGYRHDLFNFIDLIGADPKRGVIAVQVCSHGELNAHNDKLFEPHIIDKVLIWLQTPGAIFEMWGWRKLKNKLKSGKYGKGYHWEPEVIQYDLQYFQKELNK